MLCAGVIIISEPVLPARARVRDESTDTERRRGKQENARNGRKKRKERAFFVRWRIIVTPSLMTRFTFRWLTLRDFFASLFPLYFLLDSFAASNSGQRKHRLNMWRFPIINAEVMQQRLLQATQNMFQDYVTKSAIISRRAFTFKCHRYEGSYGENRDVGWALQGNLLSEVRD